jgi:3-dehydroquinate dehydratase-2
LTLFTYKKYENTPKTRYKIRPDSIILLKTLLKMKIIIINGPNLNLLGKREPEIYGNTTFTDYFKELKLKFTSLELEYYQSNIEGELIDKIQEVGFSYDGIILNAAAYTHTSIGIGDAVKAITTPVIEVHISNTFSREEFRHQSYISPNVKGIIIGFGLKSYELALQSFL